MWLIRKITLSYDPMEDRLRLSAINGDEQALELWLTQRLANKLVAALTRWLEKEVGPGYERASRLERQMWEQSAALARYQPCSPVPAAGDASRNLVTSVDLSRGRAGYQLTFRWQPDASARLAVSAIELRQWLGILHGRYREAKWPCGIWPAWFAETKMQPTTVSVH